MARERTNKGEGNRRGGCLGGILFLLCLAALPEAARRTGIRIPTDRILRVGAVLLGLVLAAFIRKIWRRKKYGLYVIPRELRRIDRMTGREFEFWCAELLRRYGFSELSVTPGSNDQGVDIIGSYQGEHYAIQCKRYNSRLGNKPIQEAYTGAAFYDCHYAVVMTNADFTPAAVEAAARTDVLLWDRDVIRKLMEKANKRLKKSASGRKREQACAEGKWPHSFDAREIDTEYYERLPAVPPVSGQLHVACTPLDGEEAYQQDEDCETDAELIQLSSPIFSTEREAEHFKAAITKKYYALARRNGTVVTAWIHAAYIRDLFDPERCIYVLDNYCE